MRRFSVFMLGWLIGFAGCAVWPSVAIGGDEDAGQHVHRKVMDNGLEVVVYSDPDLAGEPIQVWTRIHRGSMSERDHERGAALVAARSVMQGVGGLSREELLAMAGVDTQAGEGSSFESAGALVANDHIAWMLGVDSMDGLVDGFTVAGAILGCSDGGVDATGLSWLSDERVGRIREGVLEEINAIDSERGEQWLYRQWLPDLLDGSGFSRVPMPGAEECGGLDASVVRSYVDREWIGSQASVLVVGDVDAGDVFGVAEGFFSECGAGCASGCGSEERATAVSAEPMIRESVDGRVVSASGGAGGSGDGEDGIESSRIGLVWFDRDEPRMWDDVGHREALTLALAGETMRYRVNRMLRRSFDSVADAKVDAGKLMGRIPFGQFVVEFDGHEDWEALLVAMEIERTRMARDGVGDDEVRRAKEWMLQQWGYQTEQWDNAGSAERAQILNWLMASGRPLVDLGVWYEGGRGLLGEIGRDEINGQIRSMIGGKEYGEWMVREPAVVVVLDGADAPDVIGIQAVLDEARGLEPAAIGDDWISGLQGPILSRSGERGEVAEISMHHASGTMSTVLSNGVRVHHREMRDPDEPELVSMVVRVGFDSIEDASMSGAGDVFAAAIDRGMIRSRSGEEVRGIMIEDGLELEVMRGVWDIEIRLDIERDSFERGAELIEALLTDFRIERGLVEELARQGEEGSAVLGVPIGAMEVGIARSLGVGFALRDTATFGSAVDARSVREWVYEQVRGGAVEIGIAGPVDAEDAMQVMAMRLGGIRGSGPLDGIEISSSVEVEFATDLDSGVEIEEAECLVDPSGRVGVMVGFGACRVDELDDLRSLTVAGMVLDRRLKDFVDEHDAADEFNGGQVASVISGALLLDLVPGRVVVFSRVDCDPEQIEIWAGVIQSAMQGIADEGISAEELAWARGRIDGALGSGAKRAAFWAERLSLIGTRGGDVESIWTIRDAYQDLELEAVNEVFGRWFEQGEHLRVELLHEQR